MSEILIKEAPSLTTTSAKESFLSYIPWEKEFPHLVAFLKDKSNWTNVFKLLIIAHTSINNEDVYSTKTARAAKYNLQRAFREWWSLFRTNVFLQDPKLKNVGKNLREFVVAASEEPTHDVILDVRHKEAEPVLPKKRYQPEALNMRSKMGRKRKMMKFKRLQVAQVTREKNLLVSKLSQMRSFSSSSSPSNHTRSRTSVYQSIYGKPDGKMFLRMKSNLSPQGDASDQGSVQFVGYYKDADVDTVSVADLYMQIIMKDIASDLTKKEKENAKKLMQLRKKALLVDSKLSMDQGRKFI